MANKPPLSVAKKIDKNKFLTLTATKKKRMVRPNAMSTNRPVENNETNSLPTVNAETNLPTVNNEKNGPTDVNNKRIGKKLQMSMFLFEIVRSKTKIIVTTK